jgi:hypothetical protein
VEATTAIVSTAVMTFAPNVTALASSTTTESQTIPVEGKKILPSFICSICGIEKTEMIRRVSLGFRACITLIHGAHLTGLDSADLKSCQKCAKWPMINESLHLGLFDACEQLLVRSPLIDGRDVFVGGCVSDLPTKIRGLYHLFLASGWEAFGPALEALHNSATPSGAWAFIPRTIGQVIYMDSFGVRASGIVTIISSDSLTGTIRVKSDPTFSGAEFYVPLSAFPRGVRDPIEHAASDSYSKLRRELDQQRARADHLHRSLTDYKIQRSAEDSAALAKYTSQKKLDKKRVCYLPIIFSHCKYRG